MHAAPLHSQAIPRNIWLQTLVCVLLFILFRAPFLQDALLHADTAEYAADMAHPARMGHPYHLSWIWLGTAWQAGPGQFWPQDLSLNIMNLLVGAVCLGLVSLLSWQVLRDRTASLLAVAALAVSYPFVYFSVFAEIYVLQGTLLTGALLMQLRGRVTVAAFLLALAVLCTPLSIFSGIPLLMLRPSWKHAAILIGIPLALLSAVVLWQPIYLASGRFSMAADTPFQLVRQLGMELNEWVNHYGFLLPFVAHGCILLLKNAPTRPLILGWGIAALLQFGFGERYYDVPGQLPIQIGMAVPLAVSCKYLMSAPLRPRHRIALLALGVLCTAVVFISLYMQRSLLPDGLRMFNSGIRFFLLLLPVTFAVPVFMLSKSRQQAVFLWLICPLLLQGLYTHFRCQQDGNQAWKKTNFIENTFFHFFGMPVVASWTDLVMYRHEQQQRGPQFFEVPLPMLNIAAVSYADAAAWEKFVKQHPEILLITGYHTETRELTILDIECKVMQALSVPEWHAYKLSCKIR